MQQHFTTINGFLNAITRNTDAARKLPQRDPQRVKLISTATIDCRNVKQEIANCRNYLQTQTTLTPIESDRFYNQLSTFESNLQARQKELMRLAAPPNAPVSYTPGKDIQDALEAETRHLTETQILNETDLKMKQGDEEIEKMYKMLQPIKNGQRAIGDEIDEQNQQISDLKGDMEETNLLIKHETDKLASFKQHSKRNWPYWLVILILIGIFVMWCCTHWSCDLFPGGTRCPDNKDNNDNEGE